MLPAATPNHALADATTPMHFKKILLQGGARRDAASSPKKSGREYHAQQQIK